MIAKTCCFTGHRKIPVNRITEMKKSIISEVNKLIAQDVIYYGTGGALGFDTIAAQTILEMKKDYPQIKLILIIPCKNQADNWNYEDRILYEDIKNRADKVVYLADNYEQGCMLKRNIHMVNNSKYVIAAWDGRKQGGTYYTLKYAQELNRNIILLDFWGD